MTRITRAAAAGAAATANNVKTFSPSVSPALQAATLVKQEQDDTEPPKRRAPSVKEDISSRKRNKTSKSTPSKTLSPPTSPESKDTVESQTKDKKNLSEKKFSSWSQHAHSSPFPDFARPTVQELKKTHDILEYLHGDRIRQEWADPDAPSQDYPYVMDALVVAALSQATSWANAKRAMKNMKHIYGSTFSYDAIVEGGINKLRDALRPGGLQNRKSKILMDILYEVKKRYGKWDLQFLFNATDEEAVKEAVRYKGLGPKCAFCLLSICLKRDKFAVDTHIFRIAKLWGWCPQKANKETAQAHLDARIPNELNLRCTIISLRMVRLVLGVAVIGTPRPSASLGRFTTRASRADANVSSLESSEHDSSIASRNARINKSSFYGICSPEAHLPQPSCVTADVASIPDLRYYDDCPLHYTARGDEWTA